MLLQIVTLVLLAPAALVACYYLVLAGVACWPRRQLAARSGSPQHRFVILIPAHNEEATIGMVLRSCADLDYPQEQLQIVAVADNCDDATARVARAAGAACLERNDPQRRGKGHALAWAMPQVLSKGADAVVIVDADCRLDGHALRAFDECLSRGDRVLQASYVAANPDTSLVSYVAAVANLLENDFYYAPKSRLGLSVLLRGTGMVFHRDVLEQVAWRAHSIVEDAEYTVRLYEAGYAVRFLPDVRVWSEFPDRPDQLQVQRTRWIGGTVRLGLRWSAPLLRQGGNRPVLLDLAWTLLATARSLVVLDLLAACILALLANWVAPGSMSGILLVMCLGLAGLWLIYFGMGAARLGLDRRRWRMLSRSPATVARFFGIAAASMWPGRDRGWVRTPR